MGHNLNITTELYILLKTLSFPLPSSFGLWNRISTVGGGKSVNSSFFSFALGAVAFFSRFFSFTLSRSFFGFVPASLKAWKKRRRSSLYKGLLVRNVGDKKNDKNSSSFYRENSSLAAPDSEFSPQFCTRIQSWQLIPTYLFSITGEKCARYVKWGQLDRSTARYFYNGFKHVYTSPQEIY